MDSLFLDTDTIIDVLTEREPFYKPASSILSLAEKNKIKCFTSPLVVSNINYIVSKVKNIQFAKRSLRELRNYIEIAIMDQEIVDLALGSDFKDFEDAMQYYTALKGGADFIITRNKKDYSKSQLPIFTAEEYLKFRKAVAKAKKRK